MPPLDAGRLRNLSEKLLSPDVQVPEPAHAEEVPAKLSAKEVEKIIVDHVPGVRKFLFRDQPGQMSLKFMVSAYQEGWRAFRGTDLHNHLLWLMRRVIHHGHEGGADAARHLGDVAEAFRDCQAVQARVVERVGLQIVGVAKDFRGQAVRLAGEYKTLALQMLAQDRLAEGLARDYDDVPTHYENRLTADIGPLVGANADDIRRAELDEHAASRFSAISGTSAQKAAARCRELFEAEAMLSAFVAEVNSFSEASPQDSLSRTFLDWASENLAQKHLVFDTDTCSRVEIDAQLALCVFEALFLGGPDSPTTETYRGISMREVFEGAPSERADAAEAGQRLADGDGEAAPRPKVFPGLELVLKASHLVWVGVAAIFLMMWPRRWGRWSQVRWCRFDRW